MADRLIRSLWYSLADANTALDEYYDAFGDTRGFYLRGTNNGDREDEANYADRIRRAIRQGTPMTEDEILDMYGIVYEEGAVY